MANPGLARSPTSQSSSETSILQLIIRDYIYSPIAALKGVMFSLSLSHCMFVSNEITLKVMDGTYYSASIIDVFFDDFLNIIKAGRFVHHQGALHL